MAGVETPAGQGATAAAQVSAAGVSGNTRNAGVDKETRLMLLCYGMLDILDQRMEELMDVMQARNERASQLKGLIADMNAVKAKFDGKAESDSELKYNKLTPEGQGAMNALDASLQRMGVPGLESLMKDGKIKKGDLDAAISKVTGMMDSDATIQQLEMFTLQSTFSKRNEMYELMSNALKKCQDTKSSLVRNF